MPNVTPFWNRRPRKPWSGLVLAGAIGAVATALVTALAAGWWVAGSWWAHTHPAALLSATAGTAMAALAAGAVVAPGLWWGLRRFRMEPLTALGLFGMPWVLAVGLAVAGWPAALHRHAGFLLAVFLFQSLASWAVFAYWAYPPYPSRKTTAPESAGVS